MQAVGVVGTIPCIAFLAPLTSCVPQGQVHKATHPFFQRSNQHTAWSCIEKQKGVEEQGDGKQDGHATRYTTLPCAFTMACALPQTGWS